MLFTISNGTLDKVMETASGDCVVVWESSFTVYSFEIFIYFFFQIYKLIAFI